MTEAEQDARKKAEQERQKNERDSQRTGKQVGFVVDNSNMVKTDPDTDEVVPWKGSDARFDRIFGNMRRAARSASDKYVGESAKQDAGGYLSREIFVGEEDKGDVHNALEYEQGSLLGGSYNNLSKQSRFFQKKTNSYEGLRMVRKIVGSENKNALKKLAREQAYSVSYSKDKGKGDYATVSYRFPSEQFARYEQEHAEYLEAERNGQKWTGDKQARYSAEQRAERTVFGDILASSRKEEEMRLRQDEDRRLDKLWFRNKKRGGKYTSDYRRYSDYPGEDASEDEKAKTYDRLDDDERRKRAAKKKQEEKEAEEKEDKRVAKAMGKMAIAILLQLLDMLRRLVTAAMKTATDARQDGHDARAAGISLYESRQYRNMEESRGLPQGTTVGYFKEIQEKFGDERHIDQEALDEVAPYLPSYIVKLIRSGQADADKVGKEMLDSAMQLILNEKRWDLSDAGSKEESFLSIYNSFKRAFPQGAEILKQMYLVNQTGVDAGKAETFDTFKQSSGVMPSTTRIEYSNLEETGQILQKMNTTLKTIIDDWLTDFAINLKSIFNWIKDLDIGMDPEQKYDKHRRYYEESKKVVQNLTQEQGGLVGSLESIAKDMGVDLSKDGYKNMKDFADASASGLSTRKIKGKAQVVRLLSDPRVRAMLELYAVNENVLDEAKKNIKAGDTNMLKTKDIAMMSTPTARAAEVENRIKYDMTAYDTTSKEARGSVTSVYSNVRHKDKDSARRGGGIIWSLFDTDGLHYSYEDIEAVVKELYPDREFTYDYAKSFAEIFNLYGSSKQGKSDEEQKMIDASSSVFNTIWNQIKKRLKADNKQRKANGEELVTVPSFPRFGVVTTINEKKEVVRKFLEEHPEYMPDDVTVQELSKQKGVQTKQINLSKPEIDNIVNILQKRDAVKGAQYALYTAAAAEGGLFADLQAQIEDALKAHNIAAADANGKMSLVASGDKHEQKVIFTAVYKDPTNGTEIELWSNRYETKSSGLQEGMPIEIPLYSENGG